MRYALETCCVLLSDWNRWILERNGVTGSAASTANPQTVLINRVADLGAELCPDGLDGIWERAGGKSKELSGGYNPAERWRQAVRSAKNGRLEGGMLALVEVLLKDFQHNTELQELKSILVSVSHSEH